MYMARRVNVKELGRLRKGNEKLSYWLASEVLPVLGVTDDLGKAIKRVGTTLRKFKFEVDNYVVPCKGGTDYFLSREACCALVDAYRLGDQARTFFGRPTSDAADEANESTALEETRVFTVNDDECTVILHRVNGGCTCTVNTFKDPPTAWVIVPGEDEVAAEYAERVLDLWAQSLERGLVPVDRLNCDLTEEEARERPEVKWLKRQLEVELELERTVARAKAEAVLGLVGKVQPLAASKPVKVKRVNDWPTNSRLA